MKRIFIYLPLAATLFTVGCKTKSGKTGADGKTDVSSVTDANKIIGYTNDVIDVLKKYNEAAENAVKYYGNLEDKMNGKTTYASPNSDMNFLWTVKEKAKNAFGAPTTALGDDKKFFEDSVGTYKKLFEAFQAQDSTLKIYVKAEDFKDDNFAKGKDLITKQYEIYPQLLRLRSAISGKIEKIADAAEEVSLKDSPIREAYKNAKGDLAKFRSLADFITSKEKFTDADLATIDADYTALTGNVEKNKTFDPAKLEKENKLVYYNNFYKSLTDELAEIKPAIRNIKEKKVLTESDYNLIDRSYSSAISSYNSWVN